MRARSFAASRGEAVTYVMAKDTPSAEALRERPDLPSQKLSWLQRHDRESGDLYGVATLVRGMPVSLTDHLDRSPEKQLLRGRVGYIHSWVCQETETSTYEEGVRILEKTAKSSLRQILRRGRRGMRLEIRWLDGVRSVSNCAKEVVVVFG